MSECPVCKGPMKPLFTGSYCPKDCDRPGAKLATISKEIEKDQVLAAQPRIWSSFGGWGMVGPTTTARIALADDECRDFFCNGKGIKTHSALDVSKTPITSKDGYTCQLCNKDWYGAETPVKSTP